MSNLKAIKTACSILPFFIEKLCSEFPSLEWPEMQNVKTKEGLGKERERLLEQVILEMKFQGYVMHFADEIMTIYETLMSLTLEEYCIKREVEAYHLHKEEWCFPILERFVKKSDDILSKYEELLEKYPFLKPAFIEEVEDDVVTIEANRPPLPPLTEEEKAMEAAVDRILLETTPEIFDGRDGMHVSKEDLKTEQRNGHTVRYVERNGKKFFVAVDLAKISGRKQSNFVLNKVSANNKIKSTGYRGGLNFISEDGLVEFLDKASRKYHTYKGIC